MNKSPLTCDDAHADMLLDLARYWRFCATQTSEAERSAMMRGVAEDFESAATDIIRQTLTHVQTTEH